METMQEEEIVTNTVPHHNDDVNNQDDYQVILEIYMFSWQKWMLEIL